MIIICSLSLLDISYSGSVLDIVGITNHLVVVSGEKLRCTVCTSSFNISIFRPKRFSFFFQIICSHVRTLWYTEYCYGPQRCPSISLWTCEYVTLHGRKDFTSESGRRCDDRGRIWMMYFEEGRRGHEPKNADNPGKGKEIDSLLDPPERMQLSQHLNF